jgi:hypothetical protein
MVILSSILLALVLLLAVAIAFRNQLAGYILAWQYPGFPGTKWDVGCTRLNARPSWGEASNIEKKRFVDPGIGLCTTVTLCLTATATFDEIEAWAQQLPSGGMTVRRLVRNPLGGEGVISFIFVRTSGRGTRYARRVSDPLGMPMIISPDQPKLFLLEQVSCYYFGYTMWPPTIDPVLEGPHE